MGKQLKISDLKRVVNVDKISKYASILSDENTKDEKQIESILVELNSKTPSREVLMKTRLGFILKDLSNRESLSTHIREMARDLRVKWKEFHKRLLLAPKYDVKCDKPTSESRSKTRQSLTNLFIKTNDSPEDSSLNESNKNKSNSLFNPDFDEHLKLIYELEFKIFQYCDTLINTRYFNLVKCCIKEISQNQITRSNLLNASLTINEFVLNCCLANKTNSFQIFKSPSSQMLSNSLKSNPKADNDTLLLD